MKHYTYPSILLATLILAACGGGSGGGTAGATGDPTQTASATSAAIGGGTGSSATTSAAPTTASSATSTTSTTSSTSSSSSSPTASTSPSTSSSTSSSSTSSSATPTSPQIVEYYGDSTIYGYNSGVGGQVQTPAPLAFAQSLPNPSLYDVRNEGVSGTTACDLVNGTDGKHPAWTVQMANSKAKYVLANFAINDEWKYDINTYKSCMHTLATVAKQYGKQMIFETPNPTRDSGPGGLDTMVAAMKEVAAQDGVKVIDQYQYLTSYLNGASPYTICPDGLHPNQQVYIMKGQYAAKMFPSLVQ